MYNRKDLSRKTLAIYYRNFKKLLDRSYSFAIMHDSLKTKCKKQARIGRYIMEIEHRLGSACSLPEGEVTKEYIVRDKSLGESEDGKSKHPSRRKQLIIIGIVALLLAAVGSTGFGIKIAKANAGQSQEETEGQTTEEQLAEGKKTGEENRTAVDGNAEAELAKSVTADSGIVNEDATGVTGEKTLVGMNGLTGQTGTIDDNPLESESDEASANSGEETIAGLLWNDDLMEDIRTRIEEAKIIEEQQEFDEEDYRELLVTLGMAEDYTSNDPELPAYLTMQHNEKMEMDLTEEELTTLLRLVESEAPSEDIYGKILVANVVLNRVFSEKMANTVLGVVYEKIGGSAQFSPTEISWYWNSIVVTDSTREAVARCLSGEDYSNGALYFYAWEKHPDKRYTCDWLQKCEYLFTHGGHIFFR